MKKKSCSVDGKCETFSVRFSFAKASRKLNLDRIKLDRSENPTSKISRK